VEKIDDCNAINVTRTVRAPLVAHFNKGYDEMVAEGRINWIRP